MPTSPLSHLEKIYLQGPAFPWMRKPTHQAIMAALFAAADFITLDLQPQMPTAYHAMPLDMSLQPLNGCLLYGHPWGGFNHHLRTFHFPLAKFIGIIVAFKWFYYQHYPTEAQALLQMHLASALADSVPVNVLIDDSPPTENYQDISTDFLHGVQFYTRQERPLAEILPFYQPIQPHTLAAFINTWPLSPETVRLFNLRQKESVLAGVTASIEFFKTQRK